MSPELETLDHLSGGPLPLTIVRMLFTDDAAFRSGIQGLLLAGGEVQLLAADNRVLAPWEWRMTFVDEAISLPLSQFKLEITGRGANSID